MDGIFHPVLHWTELSWQKNPRKCTRVQSGPNGIKKVALFFQTQKFYLEVILLPFCNLKMCRLIKKNTELLCFISFCNLTAWYEIKEALTQMTLAILNLGLKAKEDVCKDNSASNVTVNNFWKVILNLFFRLNYTLGIHFIKYVYIYMHMYMFIYPEWESYAWIFHMHILYYIWKYIFNMYHILFHTLYIIHMLYIYSVSVHKQG